MIGRLPSLLILSWTTLVSVTLAQPQGFQEIRADQVKPAFSVEPVVQRLSGRRGQQLAFKFDLTSLARTTTIEIRPVAMAQDLSGAIRPDTDSPPPQEVTLTTPTRLELVEDTETTIEGTVRIPTSNSSFHTFGILVTDYGRKLDATTPQSTPADARMAIEFVTRYLLRIDIDVQGSRPTEAGQLVLESGELREFNGQPQIRVDVVNPTPGPLEFELECRLLSPLDPSLSKPFQLGMPVRNAMPPPERYHARILPGARVRMEELVPVTVYPGPYELEVSVISGRRKWRTARFPVLAEDGAFPAQAAAVAQIAPGISAAPAQIELSTFGGGVRFLAVTINNTSSEPADFTLAARDHQGQPADWFAVRPETFSLQPGGSRKVLVTLGANRPTDADRYGALAIEAKSGERSLGLSQLVAALVVGPAPTPNVQLGELAWQVDGNLPAIVVPVTNAGSRHVALDGKMTLTEIDTGVRYEFAGGFGRWLLPGASDSVRFRMVQKVPSGKYELKILLRTGVDQPTMELKTLVELSAGG